MRVFQFKILHRILSTNKLLFQSKIKEDSKCIHCGQEETLEHLLWYCDTATHFWKMFEQLWNTKMSNCQISLSCSSVIFGMYNKSTLLNHLILIGKYQLYTIRYTKARISINPLIHKAKEAMSTERKFFSDKMFDLKWGPFMANMI